MKCLLFDLDGTLVESLPGIAASLNHALCAHDLPAHSETAVRGFIGDGAKILVERALSGVSRMDLAENVLQKFAEDYATTWPHGTDVYPGIPELLAELKSRAIPLAVLSNKPHPFTVEIVERLFPKNTFTAILGNREGMPHKPDPAGALEIATSLGVSPADCILIGDSTMDLDTAKNAGMESIAVTWGYHDRERLSAAGQIAESVDQLRHLLPPPRL